VATTGSDSPDQPSLSGQAEQLIDANNQVAALKKDIFTFKERLMDSDACINKITEEYNTFARDAQLQIDKLSDDLATSHKTVDSLQVQLEKTVAEHKVTMTTYRSFEQQWDTARTTLVEENGQLKAKVTNVTKQIADLQAELNTTVEQLEQGEERYHAEVAARALDATVIAGLRDDIQHLNMDISASRSEVVGANERLRSAEVSYQKQKEHLESIQNDTKQR
jgi:chromosome segregation ATPase